MTKKKNTLQRSHMSELRIPRGAKTTWCQLLDIQKGWKHASPPRGTFTAAPTHSPEAEDPLRAKPRLQGRTPRVHFKDESLSTKSRND